MKLLLKARRYVGQAINEFGSSPERADWQEWEKHSAIDAAFPRSLQIIARKALAAKAADLNRRIDALPEQEEDAIADLGNDLGYIESLLAGLQNELVAA